MKKYSIFIATLLLLSACKSSSTADVIPTEEVRDVKDCKEEGGLVVQGEYLKCVTESGEFPLGKPIQETQREPGAEDWKNEPFFLALQERGEALDFTWDMDPAVMGEHGKTVVLQNEMVFFFRFASAEEAQQDITSVQESGKTTKGMGVYWGEDAAYFRNGAVVAVYNGHNENIVSLLEQASSS
ncbi:hypothetical protein COU76_02365 [Candidatus Peregrinibacteria bacterium CG10_big_fil_rev_8_21_14_0_10_49_10]|nr:MAG: hypothetical protein COU76_02365 [Candidatus Peregrinibacteria bacterium CG10_big_fil_rev_8_21_14_0_10_49_10]